MVDLEKAMNDLNKEINQRIFEIENRVTKIKIRILSEGTKGFEYTHCQDCKRNCHDPCDCIHLFTSRCTIFPIFNDYCERCGCRKESHIRDGYRYKYIDISDKRYNNYDPDEIEKTKQEKKIREAKLIRDISGEKRKKIV